MKLQWNLNCNSFPGSTVVKKKNLPGNARDADLIPEPGRSTEGCHSNPLQYSCQRIPWTEEPGEL